MYCGVVKMVICLRLCSFIASAQSCGVLGRRSIMIRYSLSSVRSVVVAVILLW